MKKSLFLALMLSLFLASPAFALQIYNYHKNTKEFLSESTARLNPLEAHRFLIPANATIIEPPTAEQYEKQIFNNVSKVWFVQADHRGRTVWVKTSTYPHVIGTLGEIPEDYTLLNPSALNFPKWEVDQWVEDLAAAAAQGRRDDIDTAKDSSLLKTVTIDQAIAYIEAQLDTTVLDATGAAVQAATDVDELKAATLTSLIEMRNLIIKIREVNLAMVPYILPE